VPLTGPAFASRAAENAQGPGQLELGDSLDGSRCLLSPWAPPPTEKAIFARGSSGTSPPHGGKFENHARWRELGAGGYGPSDARSCHRRLRLF
jgi:hypothetical protein